MDIGPAHLLTILKHVATLCVDSLSSFRSETEDCVSHAELVVSHVREKGQLFEFQQRWRQYFLDTMQPKFLPDLWCVTHNPQS